MPEFLVSCKKADPGPSINFAGTIGVIGAGAAGLYVADQLRQKGLKVVIFEASAKLGGRIKSYRSAVTADPVDDTDETLPFLYIQDHPSVADFPLELGAETFHGSNSIWGTILKDLTVATTDLSLAADKYILDGVASAAADLASDADFITVESFVANLPNISGAGISMTSASGVSTRGKALLNSQAGNYYGSDADTVDAGLIGSDLALALTKRDNKPLSVTASLMQDILASRFASVSGLIKYNTQITNIDYTGDQITLTDSASGQTIVDKVIVTVPLAVLQSNAINFSPALSADMTASMAKFGMSACVRVILDFKNNFWGDKNTGYIWGGSTCPQFFCAGNGRSDLNGTLTLTIFGPQAATLSALGAGMIQPILDELDAAFGKDGEKIATNNVRKDLDDETIILYTIQDWTKEKFIKGGISYPMVGATAADRTVMGTPIGGRVFFAGEATDVSGNAGTINGALASAERVAMEVVTSIIG